MKRVLSFLKTLPARLRSTHKNDPRLPSLVKALRKVAPQSVIREVVGTASDRRQWGVLTAAWIGVSEKELMQAVARELKLDFVERVPRVQGILERIDGQEVLQQLRQCAAVPVFDGVTLTGFIAVDPAEVRGTSLYTGSQGVSLGCWSEISRALQEAERELREREDDKAKDDMRREESLCARVVDVIIQEAHSHGSSSVEIVTIEGGSRYQFVTSDGKRGYGNIHKGIVPTVLRYLARLDGGFHRAADQSEVMVRSLGNLTNFKLMWSAARVESTPLSIGFEGVAGPLHQEAKAEEPSGSEGLSDGALRQGPSPEIPTKSAEPSLGGDPILVIDDNPMFCRVLERLLQRDGFAPSFAENGAIGLEKLGECQHLTPKAIVCDLHMPRMNGKEFVEQVRKDPRYNTIPIIMLTSDDDAEAEVALLGIGADAFVSKTRDPRVLCAQIRRLSQQGGVKVAA